MQLHFRMTHAGIQIMMFLSRKQISTISKRKVIGRIRMHHNVFQPTFKPLNCQINFVGSGEIRGRR